MGRIAFIVLFVICGQVAIAQEVWLRPEKYFYELSEVARFELQSGSDFIGKPVPYSDAKPVTSELFFRNLRTDLTGPWSKTGNAAVVAPLSGEGIHTLRTELEPLTMRMHSSEFLEFARQYGFEDAVATGASDSVSLAFKAFLKTYVRAGKKVDQRAEATGNWQLDVIADKNPLLLKRGERIVFTVLRDGRPAFGVRVKIWNRWNNRTTIQHIYTQQDGTVSTTISSPGDWMVSVAEEKKLSETSIDVTIFNLTFGFR